MSLKCLFICFLSLSSFALSEELVIKELKDVGLKNYDERSFRYVVDVTGYKPPLMEFYKTKDLSGSPEFSIRKNGLFVKNKISCSFNTLNTNERTEEVLDKTCSESPFVIEESDGPYSNTLLFFNEYDSKKKIGVLKKNNEKYYFNTNSLIKFKIHPPTVKKIEEFLDKSDIYEIRKLLTSLRSVILTKDVQQLKEYLVKTYTGVIQNPEFEVRHEFKQVFSGEKMNEYQYRDLLAATYLELMNYDKYNEFNFKTKTKHKFCLKYEEKVYTCFKKKHKKWSLSTFNISDINE